MQKGLAHWQQFLSKKPLPIMQRTKSDVQDLIDQAQLSITRYADPVLFDAAFCAYVFSQVNAQRIAAGKNPLTTISNALSHLGQAAFQKLLNKAPLFEEVKVADKNRQGYLRVMGQSCHALLQATDWAQQRNVTQPEEMQIATLLQTIAELMLWCYGDNVMPEIEQYCYVKKMSYEDAANEVIGCDLRQLGAALAKYWELPEMALEGLTGKRNNFTLATGVSLASELARVVGLNWYGKDTLKVIKKIADYAGKAEAEVEHRLHLSAVKSSDILLRKGYASPAKLIPQLADDNYIDPQFILDKVAEPITTSKEAEIKIAASIIPEKSEAIKKTEKPSVAIKKMQTDIDASKKQQVVKKVVTKKLPAKSDKIPGLNPGLAAAIKTFQLMVAQGKPAHDLIEYMVNSCLLCGVQRSVFMVKIPNKNMLVSRYSAQTSEDIKIKTLKIPIDKPHVFSLIVEKSRNLFLNESNRGKYWKSIPDMVKLNIGVKQFFIMSVFVNNHAMGVLYADKVKGDLSATEFKNFQGICRLLSKGIIQSAHNKHKQSA